MITKSHPAGIERVAYCGYQDHDTPYSERSVDVNQGADTITYLEGGKRNGKWPWKPCNHNSEITFSPGGRASYEKTALKGRWFAKAWFSVFPNGFDADSVPSVQFDDSVIWDCYNQIDLNTSDAVLLYSGVIQALPFLGGVMRFNKIMKDVWNHVSKTARKRPFTTVIKDLIQADFIDRFVISPTLADARKFQDATDYALRVVQTARERNEHAFAVSADNKSVLSSSEATFVSSGATYNDGEINCHCHKQTWTESKAFMLVRARYDMTAVSPIAIWAQRVGLTRPLDSVWDLVPFSFVVDYFSRAGDFVSALSDEMSSIDGLKGQVLAIEDLWFTLSNVSKAEAKFTGWKRMPFLGSGWTWKKAPAFDGTPAVKQGRTFIRGQIASPWSIINSFGRKISDYLSLSIDLSSTRKRTLAELVIQAKL